MPIRRVECNRLLTEPEQRLVSWLVRNGHPSALSVLDEVSQLRVMAEEFDEGSYRLIFTQEQGLDVMLSDFADYSVPGEVTTVALLGKNGRLTRLEVWVAEGNRRPTLPSPENLRAIA